MPSRQRVADAAVITPYLTHAVSHHGQVTLIPPDNTGRIRKAKKSRVRPERNVRPDDEPRFNTGSPRFPWPPTASSGRGRRSGRGRSGRGDYNEDLIPDYPPPSFQEAISSSVALPIPSSIAPPCPQFSMDPPPPALHIQSSLPISPESSSPVSPSSQRIADHPANSGSESDTTSIEIVELEPLQTQWDEDRTLGLALDERVKRELHRQRQRTAETSGLSLSPSSSTPPLLKRRHLAPLKALSPSKPVQERAMSAHPSGSPYAFPLSPSQFFRSTTSLRLPLQRSAPSIRNDNFVSRKLFLSKGKERAITPFTSFEDEPLDSWEVVDDEGTMQSPEANITATLRPEPSLFTRMSRPSAIPDTPPNSPSIDHSTSTHESFIPRPSAERMSLKDRNVPSISFLNRPIRRPPPPPVTSSLAPSRSPTSVVASRNSPVALSPSTELPSPARAPKKGRPPPPPPPLAKERNVVPRMSPLPPLSSEADRTEESATFERASEISLPSTPSDMLSFEYDHRAPVTPSPASRTNPPVPAEQGLPPSPDWESRSPFADHYAVESDHGGPSYTPRIFTSVPRRALSPLADGLIVRAGRHYPGRPLPRPPPIHPQADVQVNAMTRMEMHYPEDLLVGCSDNRRDAGMTDISEHVIRSPPQVSHSESPSTTNQFQNSPRLLSSSNTPSLPSSPVRDHALSQVPDPPQPLSSPEVPSSPPRPSSPLRPSHQAFSSTTDLDVLLSQIGDNRNGSDYDTLLLVSEFVGPATPVRNNAAVSSTDEKRPISSLLGKIEVSRRRVTKDERVKVKLSLLGVAVDRCGICLSQFKEGQLAGLGATCQHALHEKCLGSWLARSRTCPMCRVPLDPPD